MAQDPLETVYPEVFKVKQQMIQDFGSWEKVPAELRTLVDNYAHRHISQCGTEGGSDMVGRAYIADVAKRDVAELVGMLHEVYVCATAMTDRQREAGDAQLVYDRAKLLLSEHGVEV